MSGDVLLATPTPGRVATSYMQSVLACQAHDRSRDHRLASIALLHCGAGALPRVRNQAAATLLDSGASWLWMVDSDMGFAPDTLDRLLACGRPVVGALCFGLRELRPDGLFGSVSERFATLYDDRMRPMAAWRQDALIRVGGTGTGCLLAHREVFEKIGGSWFDPHPGLSEDLSFCRRIGETGGSVHVHTGIRTSHYQQTWI